MTLANRFYNNEKGAMLLLLLILLPLLWLIWSLTLDGPENNYAAVTSKRAINRAVKSAVLPIDTEQLATGIYQIEPVQARANFEAILKLNLNLNADFTPKDSSPLSQAPEILDFYIYQGPAFPYTYTYSDSNVTCNYTFRDPGIAVVLKIRSKQVFSGQEQYIYLYSAAEAKR